MDGQDWKKCMWRLSPMPYFAVMLLSTSPGTHSDFNQYAISLLVCMRESISCLCLLFLNARKTDLPGEWCFLSVISSSFGFIVAFLCFSLHLHTLYTLRRTQVKWKQRLRQRLRAAHQLTARTDSIIVGTTKLREPQCPSLLFSVSHPVVGTIPFPWRFRQAQTRRKSNRKKIFFSSKKRRSRSRRLVVVYFRCLDYNARSKNVNAKRITTDLIDRLICRRVNHVTYSKRVSTSILVLAISSSTAHWMMNWLICWTLQPIRVISTDKDRKFCVTCKKEEIVKQNIISFDQKSVAFPQLMVLFECLWSNII